MNPLDLIPNWVFAGAIGVLALNNCATHVAHEKTKAQFSKYEADVEREAREALEDLRKKELADNHNAEKVQNAQYLKEQKSAVERSTLVNRNDRLRDELSAFKTSIAGATSTAAIAAKATLATELFDSCRSEYTSMAVQAESDRLLASGLSAFISGSSSCAKQ